MERFGMLLSNCSSCVAYMIEEITFICRGMKKRSPGSEGEREAAEYMAGILKNECGCTSVEIESFDEHPDSFYGYFYCSMVFDVLCAIGHFIHPWLSIVSGIVSLFLFVFHFLLYKQVLDPLFPLKRGTNVTAIRPCAGKIERRIFLNGHTDAAWEFPLNYHFGGIVFEMPGVMALLGVIFYIALSICVVCGAGPWIRKAAFAGIVFIPFCFAVGLTFDPRRIVDGANDNLTGCLMGIALLREMERLGIDPEHTEIGVILTGSEEAGIRGAIAWSKAHCDDYKDVPTYILCFDTIHDPRFLMVNERDLNGTVASDRGMCHAFLDAAEKAGVSCREGWVPPFGGSTDSAAFTQGGFRSVCVTGLNHKLEDYYHTRRDSYDNLDIEGLENCYKAMVWFLESVDSGSLDNDSRK